MTPVALIVLALSGALCRLAALRDDDDELLDVARFFEALHSVELGRLALSAFVLGPARAAGLVPYAGITRSAFLVSEALTLFWPFGCAALFARMIAPWYAWVGTVAWGGVVWVDIARRYPVLRGEALLRELRFAQLCALFCAFAVAVAFPRTRAFKTGRALLCSLLLLAGVAAEFAGPWLSADPLPAWWTAQATWTLLLAVVALVASIRRLPWETPLAS